MSKLSDSLAATSTKLLSQFGSGVQFERTVRGAYNPQTGKNATNEVINFNGFGYATSFTKSEVDNINVLRTDVKLLLNKVDYPPIVGDLATRSAKKYKVMNVTIIELSGEDVVYELQLRL